MLTETHYILSTYISTLKGNYMHHVMPTRYKPILQPEAFLPVIVKLQKVQMQTLISYIYV